MASRNTICLRYERDALEAARFCARTFSDSAVGAVLRAPGDYPSGREGAADAVALNVGYRLAFLLGAASAAGTALLGWVALRRGSLSQEEGQGCRTLLP